MELQAEDRILDNSDHLSESEIQEELKNCNNLDSYMLYHKYSGVSLTQANCYENGFQYQDGRFV